VLRLNEEQKRTFLSFYQGETEPVLFERWLYGNKSIEQQIGPAAYGELVSFDLRDSAQLDMARALVKGIYEEACGHRISLDQIKLVLREMLSGRRTLRSGTRILAELNDQGEELVPISFVGFSSEIERLGDEAFYKDRIIHAATDLLDLVERLTCAAPSHK
jgi:hypothetical protein